MKLKLTKPIAFFDIETTGLNISSDRIVEISILKVKPDNTEEVRTYRINPTIPIPKEVIKVHGIKNEDVKDCPTFAEVGAEIAEFIKGCDLGGYNSNKFDIPVLAEELLRAQIDYDVKKCNFVDVQVVFFKMEQRTLSAAYKFYCNKNLEDAHSAEADTRATWEILQAQLDRYQELPQDVPTLSEYTSQTKNVDFAGRFVFNNKGVEVFNFGKNKGKSVEQVLRDEPGYYNWMMENDFPLYTKKVLTAIKLRSAFNSKLA